LYNVPESKAATAEDRNKDDVTACLRLCNKGIQVGITEEDLIQVFHLGKVDSNETVSSSKTPNGAVCGVHTKEFGDGVLYKLKHAEAQFKKLSLHTT